MRDLILVHRIPAAAKVRSASADAGGIVSLRNYHACSSTKVTQRNAPNLAMKRYVEHDGYDKMLNPKTRDYRRHKPGFSGFKKVRGNSGFSGSGKPGFPTLLAVQSLEGGNFVMLVLHTIII